MEVMKNLKFEQRQGIRRLTWILFMLGIISSDHFSIIINAVYLRRLPDDFFSA